MVGLCLTIVSIGKLPAQKPIDYANLTRFSKWSVVVGPKFYFKARTESYYGDYTFKNRIIPAYNFGFEYDFRPALKWSVISGLILTKEPVYSIKYRIYQKDLSLHYTEDLIGRYKSYALYTFSFPLLCRLNLPTNHNSYITLSSGIKFMYFPYGESYFGQEISDDSMTKTIEIFGLNLHSQKYSLYESFMLSTGFTFIGKKLLFKPSVTTVINFQPTIIGEYQFGNLLSSPPARGRYKLSGNYVSFNLAIGMPKRK